jgi:TolA-binding protein
MNEGIDPVEERIVAAVQLELNRFGDEMASRFAQLQRHAISESAARSDLESRLAQLTVELAAADSDARVAVASIQNHIDRLDEQTDARLADAGERYSSELAAVAVRLDERATLIEEGSQSAELHIASVAERVDATAASLTERVAQFDEDRVAMDARLDRLDRRRNEAVERLDAVEARLGGVDQSIGDVAAGVAEQIEHLARAHETMTARVNDEIEAIRVDVAETDAEALDEMKERISSALGQAELVRIEMDRFQETMRIDLDANISRLTAVETAVQDQRMDVDSAVQLERLEEVERMVLMLAPGVVATGSTTAAPPMDDQTPLDEADEVDPYSDHPPSLPRLAPAAGS